MPTVFTLLDKIRRRPEMFVGGDESDRVAQLRNLETLLYGYSLAIDSHGVDDPGRGFVQSFGTYLNERFGWPTALGPVLAILDGLQPREDPWERFWSLIDDFHRDFFGGVEKGEPRS